MNEVYSQGEQATFVPGRTALGRKTISASQAQEQGAILTASEALDHEVERLEGLLEQLHERLGYVLTPSDGKPIGRSGQAQAQSPLAEQLSNSSLRIGIVNDRIVVGILAALEL